jgi:hypothetical protein
MVKMALASLYLKSPKLRTASTSGKDQQIVLALSSDSMTIYSIASETLSSHLVYSLFVYLLEAKALLVN